MHPLPDARIPIPRTAFSLSARAAAPKARVGEHGRVAVCSAARPRLASAAAWALLQSQRAGIARQP